MFRLSLVVCVLASSVLFGCGTTMSDEPQLMTSDEALAMQRPEPDQRISYGPERLNFGQLRLPRGEGPYPVAIIIHGGCWLAEYDLGYIAAMASRLADAGVATWSIEYRRVGDIGGGWPGTFIDVGAAADHVKVIAPQFKLDLDRVVAVGHSAGGHLALWLAARHTLGVDDPLRGEGPLPLSGVAALAGIPDLAAYSAPNGCGAAVPKLLGGQPGEVPSRLERSSPAQMLPLGVPQILVCGELDHIVPLSQADTYRAEASGAGDIVSVRVVDAAGHFELVNPDHPAFLVVENAVVELLKTQ